MSDHDNTNDQEKTMDDTKTHRSSRGTHDRMEVECSTDGGTNWVLCDVAADAPMAVELWNSSEPTVQYKDVTGRTNMYRFPPK